MTTHHHRDEILAALTDDGDEWWSEDNSLGYRLSIEVDDINALLHINDADCWGRVAWAEADRDTGHYVRPKDFTGAARLLRPNGWHIDSPVWWEPYREGRKVYDSPDEVIRMTKLLGDGFRFVKLTRLGRRAPNITHHLSGVSYCWDCGYKLILMSDVDGEGGWPTDVHDCPSVDCIYEQTHAALGGVDSVEIEYLRDLVSELLNEVDADVDALSHPTTTPIGAT